MEVNQNAAFRLPMDMHYRAFNFFYKRKMQFSTYGKP